MADVSWAMPDQLLKMDDLPTERFVRFYSTFEHYALLIATISFVCTSIVIIRASTKSMGKYKWFLLHEIVWSYVFDLCICLWAIVPLFPYQCGYSIGLMRNTNPYAMQFVVKLVIACGVGKGFSLFIALLHRNIQALPESALKDRYQKSKRLGKIFFVMWLAIELAIVGPLYFADIGNQEGIRSEISARDPIMKQVYDREPSTVCYDLNPTTKTIYATIGFLATSAILSMPFLMANMFYWIWKSRKTVTRSTFRIQWMLFISIVIQVSFLIQTTTKKCFYVICAFFCLVVPLYVGMAVDLLGMPKAPVIVCALLCLACMHSTLDCLVLVTFVRPYRRFVFGGLLRLLRLEDLDKTTGSMFVTGVTSMVDPEISGRVRFNSILVRPSIS